jgi:hypothetical protein
VQFGVLKMTTLNVVEINGSEMVSQNSILNSAGDDSMSKKIYECRLRLDDEMHVQMKSILNNFENSGMSQRETIAFLLEVGMWISMNLYDSQPIWCYGRIEVAMGLCEDEVYRKDKINVNFVRKFNDSPIEEELLALELDGRVLEKMKNFTKLIGEHLDLENEKIMERALEKGIRELYRTQDPLETVECYEYRLKVRKYY